jgi:hypothetical protein
MDRIDRIKEFEISNPMLLFGFSSCTSCPSLLISLP